MLKINEKGTLEIKALITAKATVAKIKGAVHYLNEAGKEATDLDVRDYLAGIGYASIRATNFIADYYERLTQSELSSSEFKQIINVASANVIKHEKHYDNIRLLCNEIRRQAIALAKEADNLEDDLDVEVNTNAGKALDKDVNKGVKPIAKSPRG